MTRVLVTGGTGTLGAALVETLPAAGYEVRATTRDPERVRAGGSIEWRRVDVDTGDGLDAAVAGVDAVIHAVNSSGLDSRRVNVTGLQRLLAAAEGAGVRHVVYPSIVGIDAVPYSYYRQKLEAEALVAAGPVPWTIVRATQFHPLVDWIFGRLAGLRIVLPAPRLQLQPVDAGEVAQRLIECLAAGPAGPAPDFAGPEVLDGGELARSWKQACGVARPVLPLPLPGRLGRALRAGALTDPGAQHGTITWQSWLARKYQSHA